MRRIRWARTAVATPARDAKQSAQVVCGAREYRRAFSFAALAGGAGTARMMVAAVVVFVVGLFAQVAAAAKPYGVVTVDLRPEVGEVPTHLCVVSQGKGPRTRDALSELLVGPGAAGGEAGREAGETGQGWSLDLADPLLVGTKPSAAAATCEADGACLPAVELPQASNRADQLWVACAADSLVSDQDARAPRVLVMMLEHLEGSPPLLESLKLAGGIATIGVQAELSRIVVTARSLGGHYEAHSRAFRAEEGSDGSELVVLPIAPRCHAVEVELPGVRLRESDRERLRVRAHGTELDADTCVGPLQGNARMRVDLPRAAGFGRIEVELPPTPGETPTATRFAASWDTAWPAGELRLSPHQIAFVWAPPACVWTAGTCPDATLEGGIRCTATPLEDGRCQYLCPGEPEPEPEAGGEGADGSEVGETEWVDVSPPVAVSFEKDDPDQRWTEIVQRPGQTLGAYVEPEQIYLHADLSSWNTAVPGSRISHVELLDNDGSSRRYAVAGVDELRILAPHATCDPLRFRLVGDRRYLEGSAAVANGEVEFGKVHKTARLLTFHVLLAQGGGPAIPYAGAPAELANPVYFTALGQLAANFRPRDPRFARVAYEMRLGGTVGQWGYYGPGSIGEDPRRVTTKLAWARLLFEPAVVVDVVPPLAISVGFGVGGSWPINNREYANTGRFNFILSPSVDARFAIRRWVALVVQGRAMLRERSFVAVDVVGTETRTRSFANVSLLGLYGVVFSF